MSKWKCGICGSEFDNFHAQGFEGTIYCPLCYYKKLYKDTELEIERLNNIIDKAIELTENILSTEDRGYYQLIFKEQLKVLKGEDKE